MELCVGPFPRLVSMGNQYPWTCVFLFLLGLKQGFLSTFLNLLDCLMAQRKPYTSNLKIMKTFQKLCVKFMIVLIVNRTKFRTAWERTSGHAWGWSVNLGRTYTFFVHGTANLKRNPLKAGSSLLLVQVQ